MARKPTGKNGGTGGRSRKKAEAEQPDVVETTLIFPEASVVQNLSKAKLKLTKSNASASGDFGRRVGEAVDTKHLDRKAFGIAAQFTRMFDTDPEKAAVTYHHVIRYMNDLDLPALAKKHGGMFAVEETGPAAAGKNGADEESAGGNVLHIGAAARKVADAAGAAPK